MKILGFLFAMIMLVACVHKPGVINILPPPTQTCDTLSVNYQIDIQPIFSTNCYSCHSTATNNGGLNLEDTFSLKKYLTYGFRGDGIYGSKLYHCMTHSNYAPQMPPTYMVDSCSLMKIKHWLNVGGPI